MNEFALTIEEANDNGTDPQVTFRLSDGEREVLRRTARVFSEDDIIAASNDITQTSNWNPTDVDQTLAELIEPLRNKWLRSREQPREEEVGELPLPELQRYLAIMPNAETGIREASIRDAVSDRLLTNFILRIDEDIQVQDDMESHHDFAGQLTIFERTVPFRIGAKDFADNSKFKAALFDAGGCELIIHCGMDELRKAVSTLSRQDGLLRKRVLTTNFGWTTDRSAYLSPSLKIAQAGIELVGADAPLRVDLGSETPACCLDLKMLDREELVRVKRHIVEDLLALNDPTVTHTLLGATAAAVLYPFANGAGRFAMWLVGRTGAGKSFIAKLFANFFGNFPVSSAPFTTWSATPNYVQRQGYFFKDATYLVDDYKPEVVQPYQVVRVLQTYADNTARGRLKADATANVLRPIRGLLVCTGEDVPEHNASATARSIIIKVPQQGKNVGGGTRCLANCHNYAGVMADFIHWLLQEGRLERFSTRFTELQQRYYTDVAGQQNDIRVATNLAQLGAAFELFAEYLGDVWDGWRNAATSFVEDALVVIRDSMLGEAKEQQASEVFLRTLADLIKYDHVRIEGTAQPRETEHKPIIGRAVGARPVPGVVLAAVPNADRLEICTSLALAAVNACLRQQGRSELKITESALLQQLREDGKLLDQNGERLIEGIDPTRRVRLDGGRQVRVFRISRRELVGE